MSVRVNDVEITDDEIDAEIRHHERAQRPVDDALRTLVIQRVLIDEAKRLGIDVTDPETATTLLLEREVHCPVASIEDCQRHYHSHPEHFTVGELVSGSHILLQVTPDVDLELLRNKATTILAELLANPGEFSEYAKRYSNCPSSSIGGSLGQLSRGDTVPEFDRAIFSAMVPGLLDYVVQTRFGFHIISVDQVIPGRLLPFQQVSNQIANALHAASVDRATQQYLKVLVSRASLDGISLDAESGLLVQ